MAEFAECVANNPKTAYEQSDWPLGVIGLVFLGIFIFLVITPFALMAAFPRAVSDASRAFTVQPPQPQLQTNPPDDLAKFQIEEDKRLNGYYWINKDKGVIHIPIEQAMRELADEGIEGFPREKP